MVFRFRPDAIICNASWVRMYELNIRICEIHELYCSKGIWRTDFANAYSADTVILRILGLEYCFSLSETETLWFALGYLVLFVFLFNDYWSFRCVFLWWAVVMEPGVLVDEFGCWRALIWFLDFFWIPWKFNSWVFMVEAPFLEEKNELLLSVVFPSHLSDLICFGWQWLEKSIYKISFPCLLTLAVYNEEFSCCNKNLLMWLFIYGGHGAPSLFFFFFFLLTVFCLIEMFFEPPCFFCSQFLAYLKWLFWLMWKLSERGVSLKTNMVGIVEFVSC